MAGKNRKEKFYIDIMNLNTEVTGSCILLVVKFPNETKREILIDCGLFQEGRYEDRNKILPFEAKDIDYVIVTHNHVDHTGRLPLLVKEGYEGKIYMSNPTTYLIPFGLKDSARVINSNAKIIKKNKKRGHISNRCYKNCTTIYDGDDVFATLGLVVGHEYRKTYSLDNNIKVTFFENGHLPGAIIGLLQVSYPGYDDINVLFTGDYNNNNMFFDVPDLPDWVKRLPVTIIQECTYGHEDSSKINYIFEENIKKAISEERTIIVPVFSLGRSQELMYTIRKLQESKKLDVNIPTFYEGKLGMRYTDLYVKDKLGLNITDFFPRNFQPIYRGYDRVKVFSSSGPKIILTTSGMGSHGPAQEYLPMYLPNKNALIHFTGYVAEGTLGRTLYETDKGDVVSIKGRQIKKEAEVKYTSEFSGHARADVLLKFLESFYQPKLILINHGSEESQKKYSKLILDRLNPKDLCRLNGEYLFRINSYGLIKSFPTKFYCNLS